MQLLGSKNFHSISKSKTVIFSRLKNLTPGPDFDYIFSH